MIKVVILIISHKTELSSDEIISLKQCHKILTNYRIVYICPEGLDIATYKEIGCNLEFDFVNPIYLSDYRKFNRFKITKLLYQKYSHYNYILFYEPDAYIFRDELKEWCEKGYSYIGAPWLKLNYESNIEFMGVGNGGFSLRKISDHLRVLNSFSYIEKPKELFNRYFLSQHSLWTKLKLIRIFIKKLTISNNTFHLFNDYDGNEDVFWSKVVASNFSWFKIPEALEASRFSFEHYPKQLYKLTSKIPMGCHAWFKHDIDFWKQYIEESGYTINNDNS